MAYTFDGIDLGTVQAEDGSFISGLVELPVVGGESDAVETISVLGTVFQFTIQTVKVGTQSELATFITAMKSRVANGVGLADDLYAYYSDLTASTINAKLKKFDFRWGAGGPNTLETTLTFVESA